MYGQIENIDWTNMTYRNSYSLFGTFCSQLGSSNTLFVNRLVLENTEAGKKVEKNRNAEYTEYNYIYTQLSENLNKEASGK